MAGQARALTEGFPEPSYDRWLAAVQKLVPGGVAELERRTYDRTVVRGLYRPSEVAGPEELPGVPPFSRGPAHPSRAAAPTIRQLVRHPDPRCANRQVLEELAGGAEAVLLQFDEDVALAAAAPNGIVVYDLADLEALLAGVPVEAGGVAIDAGWRYGAIGALLVAWWQRRGLPLERLDVPLGADPLGAAARGVPIDMEAALARMAEMVVWCERQGVPGRTLRADGHPYHAGGATSAHELGIALATATAYLRELESSGVPVERAVQRIGFRISVDADVFTGIAKLRAMRKLWYRVCEAAGASAGGIVVEAITASRMMAARDVHVNLLRTTAAAFAASAGGASAITVLPFDDALGLPSALARRLARNIQLILRHETGLDRVLDPAGGSAHLEAMTQALAREAWSVFQLVEAGGGMAAMLLRGSVQDWIAETWAERAGNVRRGLDPLVGVSAFPNLHERLPAPERYDPAPLIERVRRQLADAFDTRGMPLGSVLEAAAAGRAPFFHGPLTACTPVPARRLGEEFEALRAHGDAILARTGERPRVLLVELGRPADSGERAAFVRRLMAAGGIEVAASGPVVDADRAVAAFGPLLPPLAILAGTEHAYRTLAIPVTETLQAAGVARIWLAGRPEGLADELAKAGVERFIGPGDDAAALIEDAYHALGEVP